MSIKCPRTNAAFKQVTFDGITVDISTGCGGIWFDNAEIKKFECANDTYGSHLIQMATPYMREDLDTFPRIRCPHHHDMTMMRRYFSPKRAVEVDECPECGGIWLDPGELGKIRSLFENPWERREAIENLTRIHAIESGFESTLHEIKFSVQRTEIISIFVSDVLVDG